VQLTSEDNVKALRASARTLCRSDNAAARTVFINSDLTPAEAKLAYERRQRRRNAQKSESTTTSNVVNPATPSSNPRDLTSAADLPTVHRCDQSDSNFRQ